LTYKVETFDQEMWYGFGGCVKWPGGAAPVYREIGGWLIIADPNGVEAHGAPPGVPEGATWPTFRLDRALPTQALAKALLAGLPEDFDPTNFGFVEV
jgi:hypothetical protein